MHASHVEDEIEKLGPEESKIYFDARDALINTKDSNSERFVAAARIVRAFWERISERRRST
jgi:hypothetical protein